MIRYYRHLLILTMFCLSTVTSLIAMQDSQATITVTVEDDYTNTPVESVLVRLLDGVSEIASATTNANGVAEILINVTSNVEPGDMIPESFQVSESYPNPFEQSAAVDLQVDKAQEVKAEIYNIIGQRVASLQVNLTPGTYTLQSSLGHLAQGVYFLRIFGSQAQTVKMTKVGDRILSGGSILKINPATFVTRSGPGESALVLGEHGARNLTLVSSNESFDTAQQTLQVASDTSLTVQLSRNNEVVFRVADENSPSQDVEISLMVEGDQFSEEIITPDTLTLKSGFYTLSAEEGDTDSISEAIEIASEDQTVTVLTQVKSLAENQLQLEGLITDETSGNPIDRAYIYLLNQTTSDTLAGPLFAGSDGVLDAIANLDNGPDLDLSILYRKAGYTDFEAAASVSLPDTLTIDTTLQPAPAPAASFTVSGDQTAGSPVSFDASASSGASGEDLIYSWDFGNGKRGYGQSLSYVYPKSGNYDVTLTVAGDFGSMDSITESVNVSNAPSPPALTFINGEITSVDLEPLEGVTAKVVNDDFTSLSGTDGRIVLADIPAGVPVVVQLSKPGYAMQTVRLTPDAQSAENYFSTSMIQLEDPVTVPAIENGASITGKFGTKVSLPVDALVNSDGDVVTGEVELSMTPLDVSSDEIFSFPGGFEGVRPTGEQGYIVSFGVADFTFTQNGETLQVMPGKAAEIEIPVTNADVEFGDIIPLWTLDEETGLWIEEGTGEIIASAGSPSGLAMVAETGHFSWKNIDVFKGGTGFDSPDGYTLIPRCRNTETGQIVACTFRGKSVNSDGSVAGYAPTVVIPAEGEFEINLFIPLNKTLEVTASSGSGSLNGSATVPPVTNPGEVVRITIDLSPRVLSDEIPIAYGDFLKGKSTLSETSRYRFEGEQDDFIRIEIREGLGFEGRGEVFLLNSEEEILQQGNYSDSFTRYLFENLPETGEYFIEVVSETEISNFDIGLDLFDGPVNREIAYGDRIFDFLWPGTVNTYTFQAMSEDVLEIIAQSFPPGAGWTVNLTIKTPNPLVDYNSLLFNYDVWVKRLEEKDGIYSLEVRGSNSGSHGNYIIDVNKIDNFVDETTEIAYGDSVLTPVYEIDQINEYTFSGNEGDLIRLHVDKPYQRETSNRLFTVLRLYGPDESLIDEVNASFESGRDAGIGYILPSDGIYRVEVSALFTDMLSPEGDLYSLLLQNVENPLTKDLDDAPFAILQNEFFANELDINRYTFTGEQGQFGRLILNPAFTDRPDGKVILFDESSQLIGSESFNSNRFSSSRRVGIIDTPLTDQEYSAIVVSSSRDDVLEVSNQDYDVQLKRAESIPFNSTTSQEILSGGTKFYHIENTTPGKEISVAAVGSGFDISGNGISGPSENSVRVEFATSQSFLPTILEDPGNYLLRVSSGGNVTANFDLTVAELETSQEIILVQNDIISENGAIRLSGDIDRFDFTPDANGVVTISLLPADANSIDNSGNLRIQVRTPGTNGLISADSEDSAPEGEEFYKWEGDVSALNDYRIHVWDQEAISTGDFVLMVEFTPDP